MVLPRVDASDSPEARGALEQARALWEGGDQRSALDHVRRAAEAATRAGQESRATSLGKAAAALARAIEGGLAVAPSVSNPNLAARGVNTSGTHASAASNRATSKAPRSVVPRPRSERPRALVAKPSQGALMGSTAATAATARPMKASTAQPVANAATAVTARPAGKASAAKPVANGAAPSAAAAPLEIFEAPDQELVVTIASSDWNLPTPDALVGREAVRVAIAPGRGPGGTVMVRPLKAGEVAPSGATVALLVALEPGVPPIPRAGS